MQSKEEILDKAYNLAYKYEAERGSCPQCVLAALYEIFEISDPETIKAADALAGGTALSAEGTCGALAGGLLAISSIVGRTYKDFSEGERRRRVFQYAKKFYDRFVKEYGSPVCKNIHKKIFGRTFDLLDPKDYQEFDRMGGHDDKCTSVSGNAAKWAAEIILDLKKIEVKK